MGEFQLQAALALGVPIALQWLKTKRWFPFMQVSASKLNATTAAAIAFMGGLGIAFHFDYNTHQLIISGLSWPGIQSGLVHFVEQWIFQHAAYKGVVLPTANWNPSSLPVPGSSGISPAVMAVEAQMGMKPPAQPAP